MKSAWRLVAIQVGALTFISCGGPTASTSSPSPTIDQVKLAQLEGKPLSLPVVPPGGTCPVTPTSSIDYGNGPTTVYGGGPVYGSGGPTATTGWGDYFDATYIAAPQLTGIILVRIHDIRGDRVGVFIGPYAAGRVVGTDTIGGKAVQQQAELVLDASHHPATLGTSKWGIWHLQQGLAAGWSGCWGIQIDGVGFSEVVVGGA
jgi:hypothetical protein